MRQDMCSLVWFEPTTSCQGVTTHLQRNDSTNKQTNLFGILRDIFSLSHLNRDSLECDKICDWRKIFQDKVAVTPKYVNLELNLLAKVFSTPLHTPLRLCLFLTQDFVSKTTTWIFSWGFILYIFVGYHIIISYVYQLFKNELGDILQFPYKLRVIV